MKKTFKNIRTLAALLIASAALAACSNDDGAIIGEQPAQEQGPQVYTLTLQAGKADNAQTRALKHETTGDLTAYWADGDVVTVTKGTTSLGTLSVKEGSVSANGKTCTFTGTLTGNIATDEVLTLTYHPMAPLSAFGSQNGTLVSAAACDMATASVTVTAVDNGTNTITAGTASFETQTAVLKLTLKDLADQALKATSLKISVGGTDIFTFTPTDATYTANGDGILYFALPNAATVAAAKSITTGVLATLPITFTATVGSVTYTATKTGYKLDGGTYYATELKMAKPVDLSMVDNAGNARDKQWTANCYMVHKAGDYKLPLVYGNAIKDGTANTTAYNPDGSTSNTYCANFINHAGTAINAPWITKATTGTGADKGMGITVKSAALLWQDAKGLITKVGISGDYLTLTVGKDATTQQGNALVAAKDADGNIVWSWHIWVTTETFAADDLTTVTTGTGTLGTDYQIYKVTPVNLGWVPTDGNGKKGYAPYYQWGRKDPFKGTGAPADLTVYDIDGTAIAGLTYTASNDATIADHIKYPTTHYCNSSNGPCKTTYYNMWDAQQASTGNITTATVKTVYDPCPAGFCVPTSNLYNYIANGGVGVSFGWDDTNKGRNLTSVTPNVFFPASGYRTSNNGSLNEVGSMGFYWSASPNSVNKGHGLQFTSNNLYLNSGWQAFGFPVRAVAEE